ncbi:MAG: anti-sigma factor [Burkholderiales bacterium]|nr:anti-sigma factor [Burkholderiales bacterium]
MDVTRPPSSSPGTPPITEADLHAYADGQLGAARREDVERYLAAHEEERRRVDDWRRQNEALHALLDPVLSEPLPLRLPLKAEAAAWRWRALAAGVALCVVSASAAWFARGAIDAEALRAALAKTPSAPAGELAGFARRAAIAHAVYSPEVRRPVEVGADQEQALVTWLTRRIGRPVKAPALGPLGYELIGGRLLPGESGPVAQFMYGAPDRPRLTLYVTSEAPSQDVAFRFGEQGKVKVFYWVEGRFGYALSAEAGKDELARVAEEVYRQLKPG